MYVQGKGKYAYSILTHSKEDNSNRLGYSKGKAVGKGASAEQLKEVFNQLCSDDKVSSAVRKQLALLPIYVPNFAEDRMSDLIVSIIRKELVEFTLDQAKLLKIPIEKTKHDYGYYWDNISRSWKNYENYWIKGNDGKPLILTPKRIVSTKYSYNVGNYIQHTLLVMEQNHRSVADKKLPTKKDLYKELISDVYEKDKSKSYALDATKKFPEAIKQFLRLQESRNLATPLSDEEITAAVKESIKK